MASMQTHDLASNEPSGSWPPAGQGTDVSLLGAVNVLLRQWRLIAGVTLAIVALVVGVVLATPRTYSASMSMTTNARKGPSQGASIAAQFGISLPSGDATHSPQFYVDLVHSREILGPVADSTYEFVLAGRRQRQNLVTLLGSHARPELRRQRAIETLSKSISASISNKTNVISIAVRSPSPTLSYNIALAILRELNTFNSKDRRALAGAERRFSEQVLTDAERQLRAAEERQERFLQENRDFRFSPRLTLAHERLSRDVLMRQQVYTSLAQAAEQAKIDEVRDMPFLSVVERPEAPVLPDSRGGALKTMLALVGGLLLGALMALGRDYIQRRRVVPSRDLEEFDALRGQLAAELRHPLRGSVQRQPAGKVP
jgi:uncharacterized protein involved in exopolysaccharide biosynthesis